MDTSDRRQHWEQAHATRAPTQVSWWQQRPQFSLDLIEAAELPAAARVIDVGGGASTLVDHLIDRDLHVTVLDIAASGLDYARDRLGSRANEVDWLVDDVLSFAPDAPFDCWHDRAVFHFVTEPEDRDRYRAALDRSIPTGGAVIIATFGPDGPEMCSGLPVMRYDADGLTRALGDDYEPVASRIEEHQTPAGAPQQFLGMLFRRTDGNPA